MSRVINRLHSLKECDCEPDGTTDDGLCDAMTVPLEEEVAGQCHCKDNVGGQRCDRCLNGFWNFTKENPDGCQGTRRSSRRSYESCTACLSFRMHVQLARHRF